MGREQVSVEFTEEMKGYIGFGDGDDYKRGYEQGKTDGSPLTLLLTIEIPDIDFFVDDPNEEGIAKGYVECPELGGKLNVEKGLFNCFVDAGRPDKNAKKMLYRLFFRDSKGRPLTLSGHKDVIDNGVLNVWRDTTTLYCEILEGHVGPEQEPKAKALAKGILHILPLDFAHQLTTFRSNGETLQTRLNALREFGELFLGTLWDVYFPKIGAALSHKWNERPIPIFSLEGVKDAEVSTHYCTTGDKLGISMLRFLRKPCNDVVVLIHGLTNSTDMFIMPEHTNLVSYLLDHGFTDVWSLDWRGSMRHNYDLFPTRFNLDDIALYDIPASFAALRRIVGKDKHVHVICHCVGSITFMMSLFSGLIDGISSVISNSVSLTPHVPRWSAFKLSVAPFLMNWILRFPNFNPRAAYLPGPGIPQGKILAKLVSLFHPHCKVPACHMLSFMWGAGDPAVYEHSNLDVLTHERLGDLFGGANVNLYLHIRKMARRGEAVKWNPADPRYGQMPNNYLDRAAEIDIPILFVTGDRNHVFCDSNKITFDTLRKLHPNNQHEFQHFAAYGHQDIFMGKNSHKDVFPAFHEFLKRHSAPPPPPLMARAQAM